VLLDLGREFTHTLDPHHIASIGSHMQKIRKKFSIDDLVAALVEVVTIFVEVPWDVNVCGWHSDVWLYFHMSDLLDLASGNQEINITALQLWII